MAADGVVAAGDVSNGVGAFVTVAVGVTLRCNNCRCWYCCCADVGVTAGNAAGVDVGVTSGITAGVDVVV